MVNDETEILILGDSIAKGLFFDENLKICSLENSWVKKLESFGLNVKNKSMFGQTLKRVYEKNMVETSVLNETIKPKMCFIALGGNDSDYNWQAVEENPSFAHAPKTKLNDFCVMLLDVILTLKEFSITPILCSLCPVDSNRFLNNVLAKKFNKEKILEFLHNDPQNIYRHQEMFNNEIMKIANLTGTLFFDYRKAFLGKPNFLEYLSQDGIHPNEKGHNLIFNELAKFMENTQELQNEGVFPQNNTTRSLYGVK